MLITNALHIECPEVWLILAPLMLITNVFTYGTLKCSILAPLMLITNALHLECPAVFNTCPAHINHLLRRWNHPTRNGPAYTDDIVILFPAHYLTKFKVLSQNSGLAHIDPYSLRLTSCYSTCKWGNWIPIIWFYTHFQNDRMCGPKPTVDIHTFSVKCSKV